MRLLAENSTLVETFEELIDKCDEIYFATAWATDKHSVFEKLKENSNKVALAIIGLHFYQTSPRFIECFMQNENFFFKKSVSGVFHPKVFIFKFKDSYKIILGSANFTSGAFKKNDEISILLEVEDGNGIVSELMEKLGEYSLGNEKITTKYLALYKEKYKVQKNMNASLQNIKQKKQVKELKDSLPIDSSLNISWDEFKQEVESDQYDGFNERLELLDCISNFFNNNKFENMDKDTRKLIAGMKNNLPFNSGWFGSLEGAGFMKNVVNEHAGLLGKALEVIPRKDDISQQHFNEYVNLFGTACIGQVKTPQIASYSRFLAVIRPDFFVPINKKNEIRIREALNLKEKISIDNYWEVINQIHKQPWYRSVISEKSVDYKLWSRRAAMLDAIYYLHEE